METRCEELYKSLKYMVDLVRGLGPCEITGPNFEEFPEIGKAQQLVDSLEGVFDGAAITDSFAKGRPFYDGSSCGSDCQGSHERQSGPCSGGSERRCGGYCQGHSERYSKESAHGLPEERSGAWQDKGVTICPHCGSDIVVQPSDPVFNGDEIEQEGYCNKCYKGWTTVYRKTKIKV